MGEPIWLGADAVGPGRRRSLLLVLAVVCVPASLAALAGVAAAMLGWAILVRPLAVPERLHANVVTRTAVQAGWLAIGVAGVVSPGRDVRALV